MSEAKRYEDYLSADNHAISTCLHIATVLGDLMETDLTLVGGLVPSLLIPQDGDLPDFEMHCGTLDVDLGLSLAILDAELYATIAEKLRSNGFSADIKDSGQTVIQRWRTPQDTAQGVTTDFLIPQSSESDKPSSIKHLEEDFGAIITPGLQLVTRDWKHVVINGCTLNGEITARTIRVCGPGAFIVLKARALHNRHKEKDAYDLLYMLRYFGDGIEDIAEALNLLMDDADAVEAMKWLKDDFSTIDSPGPLRTARFRLGIPDDDLQADAMGLVQDLLRVL